MSDTTPPASDANYSEGPKQYVMPNADGAVQEPTWLVGLESQRAAATRRSLELTVATPGALTRGIPIAVRGLGVAIAAAVGGAPGAAPKLRKLFESQGPTYLKLGQMISGGSGLFPQPIIDAFADFRDALPAEPWDHVERVLDEEIPGGASRFRAVERIPIAAASIAQVHAAVLHDGTEVVIKVQRPAVAAQLEADLRLLSSAAHYADKLVPAVRTANLPGIVGYLADTLTQELDFRLEAENMLDVGWSLSKGTTSGGVVAPRPHAELVSRRVLVMERFRGIPSADAERARRSGVDIEQLMRNGFRFFLEGALLHGVFHGDLHPGNVLVLPDGRYGILDFGIVGRIDTAGRLAFARLLEAGFRDDHRGQLEAMRDMGAFPADADLDVLERDIDATAIPIGSKLPSMQTVAGTIRANLQMMIRHHFRLPTLLVLLSKNLLFANDTLQRYAPDMDLLGETGPFILQTLMEMQSNEP